MNEGRGRAVIGCLLLAAALFTWRASVSWDTTVDDAWISARYAEHLANGHGLVYSHGEPPVEGYTNMGFTLLLALGRLFGIGMYTLLTGVGYAFGLLSVGLAMPLTRALAGRPTWTEFAAPVVVALSPHLAVASTNGLESSMMVAMTMLATWAVLVAEDRQRWGAAAAVAGLVWTRPEGAVIAALLCLYTLYRHRTEPREARIVVGTAIAAVVSLVGLRLLVYGMVVPNTFFAKSSFPLTSTFKINKSYLTPETWTLTAGLAAWLLTSLAPPYNARRAIVSLIALAAGLIPLTVNLWMPGLRLFLPALALVACLLLAAASRLPFHLDKVMAAAFVVVMAAFHTLSGERVRHYDWRHSVAPNNGTALAAQHLARHLPKGAVAATRDAGVMAYWLGTDVKVAELHNRALTQPHVDGKDSNVMLYTPPNPEAFIATQRRSYSEEFIYNNDRTVFRTMDQPYRYMGRVYQHYHRYYDIYVRGDIAIPPLPGVVVENRKGVKPKVPVTP